MTGDTLDLLARDNNHNKPKIEVYLPSTENIGLGKTDTANSITQLEKEEIISNLNHTTDLVMQGSDTITHFVNNEQ